MVFRIKLYLGLLGIMDNNATKGNTMRQTALRVKMNLALKANIADMAEFAKAVQINEKLRAYAKELGYVETADFSSVVGSFDFGDDKPEFAHKGDSASGD